MVLNLDCNLACPYCYEDSFRGKNYMSAETAALLVETIRRDRIDKGQPVQLTFYGGEPLLSLDLIRAISLPLREAAQEQGSRLQLFPGHQRHSAQPRLRRRAGRRWG